MSTIVFAAFDDVALADRLADRLGAAAGEIESRRFPDEEMRRPAACLNGGTRNVRG